MTQNLRIINITISSSDSDIDNGSFQIPSSNLNRFTQWQGHLNDDAAYYDIAKFDNGAYYTWHIATAGSGTSSNGTPGWNAPNSICPYNWELPTGKISESEYMTLLNKYPTVSELTTSPIPNFQYSGYIYNAVMNSVGTMGVYWTSSVDINENGSDCIHINKGGNVSTGGNYARTHGFSVRCIAK